MLVYMRKLLLLCAMAYCAHAQIQPQFVKVFCATLGSPFRPVVHASPGDHVHCTVFFLYDKAAVSTYDVWSTDPIGLGILLSASYRAEGIPNIDIDIPLAIPLGSSFVLNYAAASKASPMLQINFAHGSAVIIVDGSCPIDPFRGIGKLKEHAVVGDNCVTFSPNPGWVGPFGLAPAVIQANNLPPRPDPLTWTAIPTVIGTILFPGITSALVASLPTTPAPNMFIVGASYQLYKVPGTAPKHGDVPVYVTRLNLLMCDVPGWKTAPAYFTTPTDQPDTTCVQPTQPDLASSTQYCAQTNGLFADMQQSACVDPSGLVSTMQGNGKCQQGSTLSVILCPNSPPPVTTVTIPSGAAGVILCVDLLDGSVIPCDGDGTTPERRLKAKDVTSIAIAQPDPPFGVVDASSIPTGLVSGTVHFTGFALSLGTVSHVSILRDPAPYNGDPTTPNDFDGMPVKLGDAKWLPGARPDVASQFQAYPNSDVGWAYDLDTTTLQNGQYTLNFVASDPIGQVNSIGRVVLSISN